MVQVQDKCMMIDSTGGTFYFKGSVNFKKRITHAEPALPVLLRFRIRVDIMQYRW